MVSRVGVDVGGTFTDLIFYDETAGSIVVSKALTTPDNPERGCNDAITQAHLGSNLPDVELFLHGTTVGLNALIERRGAVVGLLCTNGFRDILEFRRGGRKNFDLKWSPTPPLVPRHLRLPVRERVTARGDVVTPIERADVLEALETFRGEGVTGIAVAYMNAYRNGEHELETEKILREAGFSGAISLSHKVSGEYREYERTSTTVIDAFVRSRMSEYLDRLEGGLREQGFKGLCLITRSGGGSMTFGEAADRPFETIMSGPVAGAEGAAELSRRLRLGDVITADVGGTSFDSCVIVNGRPHLLYEGEIVDLPVQTPWVDVRSIGAGGGSIAYVDAGGLLRVGPESAGASPGPACYARGGTKPTLTDAALCLGMFGEARLASGLKLDLELARAAVRPLQEKLGMDLPGVCRGVISIAAVSMANTIREITIEKGLDPRLMKLMAFGGAGPLLATEIARVLDIDHIIVPPHAGNFSAWGLLGADLVRAEARTRILPLEAESLRIIQEMTASMFDGLARREAADQPQEPVERELSFDMRYRGQEHTITVFPGPELHTPSVAELGELFSREYKRTFGSNLHSPVEIVTIRAALRRRLPRRKESVVARAAAEPRSASHIAHSFALGRAVEFQLLQRDQLERAIRKAGPMIVSELTTTTYVDADFDAELDSAGCIHLYRQESAHDSER